MPDKMNSAFTLLELIVAMSVIAILLGTTIVTYPSMQIRSRDVKREDDLREYSAALEKYSALKQGVYPTAAPAVVASSLCTALGIGTTCADDPKAPTMHYYYLTDSDGIKYVLWSQLEKSTDFRVFCSNGLNGYSTATSSDGSCPIPTPTP